MSQPLSNSPPRFLHASGRRQVSPATDPERYWLENVYQGGVRQLTVRAVIAGMLIGAVMCLSNLYVVLKTGWSMGVTITVCILAFALFSVLRKLRLVKDGLHPAGEQRHGLGGLGRRAT